MTLVVCLVCFFAFVWLARRLKALDDRQDVRDGFPADSRRHDWH
jgi:hypothetical protein